MITKTITFQQFIDAIRQNGYNQITEFYTSKEGACAYGQAGLNLDIAPSALHTQLIMGPDEPNISIVTLNDLERKSLSEIADILESSYSEEARVRQFTLEYDDNWKDACDLPESLVQERIENT